MSGWTCTKEPTPLVGTVADFSVIKFREDRLREEAERFGTWERRCPGCGIRQRASGHVPPPEDVDCHVCTRRAR